MVEYFCQSLNLVAKTSCTALSKTCGINSFYLKMLCKHFSPDGMKQSHRVVSIDTYTNIFNRLATVYLQDNG